MIKQKVQIIYRDSKKENFDCISYSLGDIWLTIRISEEEIVYVPVATIHRIKTKDYWDGKPLPTPKEFLGKKPKQKSPLLGYRDGEDPYGN